jgi:hypothetical protein
MGPTALNIRDKTDAAGIMLIFLPVQTLIHSLWGTLVYPLLVFTHDDSFKAMLKRLTPRGGSGIFQHPYQYD